MHPAWLGLCQMNNEITASVKAAGITFQIKGSGIEGILRSQDFEILSRIPKKCGNCSCREVRLNHRVAGEKKHHFYEVVCPECNYRMKISKNEDTNALYIPWDREWEPPYQGQGGGQQQSKLPPQTQQQGGGSDDDANW